MWIRPATGEETRTPHVVQCSEPRREVTVTQSVAGRAVDRKYTFDKVNLDLVDLAATISIVFGF